MSLLFCCNYGFSQSAVVMGGGDVYVAGVGGISATVGQVDFQYTESAEGSFWAGMQQPVFIKPDEETGTSLWKKDDFSIRVYPIPTNDVCHFSIEGGGNVYYDYFLTDFEGRILLRGTASNGAELDLSALHKGIYLLKVDVHSKQKGVVIFKIIKD